MEALIDWLEEEIEEHKGKENAGDTSWERGFENGSMTEAIRLKAKIREMLLKGEIV